MLSARQPPLGLSVTSWPLGSLNFALSQFANSLFGDIWDMFCKKLILIWLRYFRYLEKKRYIWRKVKLETFEIYLQTFDWRYFEIFEVFWNESLLWWGICWIFVLYLLVFVWRVICWCHHLKDICHALLKDIKCWYLWKYVVNAILGKIFVHAII